MAAGLRRNVGITKEVLGAWEVYPPIYIMFVGPAGSYKTVTMKFAHEILDEIKFLTPAPTIVTQAALLTRLVESKDNSVYIFSKEFSDLMMKSDTEMYEFLTSMFDGDSKYESATISRGIEMAHNPCISMFAATTPEWITGSMPEQMIGGGFASRCIFVCEGAVKEKRLYFKDSVNMPQLLQTKQDLIDDLKHIATALRGNYDITPDAMEFMEAWNKTNIIPEGKKIAAYFNRKPTHAHKIAMLLHAARSDTMVLEKQDFEEAIYILNALEPGMSKIYGGVGKNPYTADIKDIYEFIRQRGPITREEVLITFESSAPPHHLEMLVEALIKTKRVIAKVENNSFYLSVPN